MTAQANIFFDFNPAIVTNTVTTTVQATAGIKENEKNFQIEIAAPGLKKEDFNVDVENGMLTISSEKKEEKEEKKNRPNLNGEKGRQEANKRSLKIRVSCSSSQTAVRASRSSLPGLPVRSA